MAQSQPGAGACWGMWRREHEFGRPLETIGVEVWSEGARPIQAALRDVTGSAGWPMAGARQAQRHTALVSAPARSREPQSPSPRHPTLLVSLPRFVANPSRTEGSFAAPCHERGLPKLCDSWATRPRSRNDSPRHRCSRLLSRLLLHPRRPSVDSRRRTIGNPGRLPNRDVTEDGHRNHIIPVPAAQKLR